MSDTRDSTLRGKDSTGIVQARHQINKPTTLTKRTEEMGENQYPSWLGVLPTQKTRQDL